MISDPPSGRAGCGRAGPEARRRAASPRRPRRQRCHAGAILPPAMRFEKWQALGNDYLIVEAAELPWPLTPGRVRRLCDAHTGVGSDGVLVVSEPDEPGFVARLRIFNPDRSEAELSGTGVREAVLYLRRACRHAAD